MSRKGCEKKIVTLMTAGPPERGDRQFNLVTCGASSDIDGRAYKLARAIVPGGMTDGVR